MDNQISELLTYTKRNARLELNVRINESESYAPLGLDIEQFRRVLFVAGVAELIYCFVGYVGGNTMDLPYTDGSLREFEGRLPQLSDGLSPSSDDLMHGHSVYEAIFLSQFRQRNGGLWSIGSTNILRVELVEIYKENPTVGKIIATGVVGAMLILSSCVGGVWVMQQRDAGRCRSEHIELARESTEMIARQARLEGRMTQQDVEALTQIHETLRAGIAASGAHVDGVKIVLDPSNGKVVFDAGASELKKDQPGN